MGKHAVGGEIAAGDTCLPWRDWIPRCWLTTYGAQHA
jgi:hypothetical protein